MKALAFPQKLFDSLIFFLRRHPAIQHLRLQFHGSDVLPPRRAWGCLGRGRGSLAEVHDLVQHGRVLTPHLPARVQRTQIQRLRVLEQRRLLELLQVARRRLQALAARRLGGLHRLERIEGGQRRLQRLLLVGSRSKLLVEPVQDLPQDLRRAPRIQNLPLEPRILVPQLRVCRLHLLDVNEVPLCLGHQRRHLLAEPLLALLLRLHILCPSLHCGRYRHSGPSTALCLDLLAQAIILAVRRVHRGLSLGEAVKHLLIALREGLQLRIEACGTLEQLRKLQRLRLRPLARRQCLDYHLRQRVLDHGRLLPSLHALLLHLALWLLHRRVPGIGPQESLAQGFLPHPGGGGGNALAGRAGILRQGR
mmetsp:Transcript_26232/g.81486  ORF Transcript_26232/g.81486 Transcript_26232/m.81486 type:complete len:364 (-) Transcript_26232:312-1403(-)